MKTIPLTKITTPCYECYGTGETSNCCNSEVHNNKCSLCGKFCKTELCMNCGGHGFFEYNLGDEVEIFICIYIPEYLKTKLHTPKKYGDNKTFKGKIIKIIDKNTVEVKIKYKNITLPINVEDVDVI
jgi:hypothetical protein